MHHSKRRTPAEKPVRGSQAVGLLCCSSPRVCCKLAANVADRRCPWFAAYGCIYYGRSIASIRPKHADCAIFAYHQRAYVRKHIDTPSMHAQPSPQRAFAVVEVGPTQFKVAVDDMIVTERLRGADVNQTVALNRVLMLGDQARAPCNPQFRRYQVWCMFNDFDGGGMPISCVPCEQDETHIGRPLVPDARVIAAVEVLLPAMMPLQALA